MKRPQFSLRLMLLVVALIASLIGWQTAIEQKRRNDRNSELKWEQSTLAQYEKYRERYKAEIDQSGILAPVGSYRRIQFESDIRSFDFQINRAKQRIDELSK